MKNGHLKSILVPVIALLVLLAASPMAGAGECEKCRRTVQQDWNYCAWCGVKLVHKCPGCNKPIKDPSWKFCPHCQASLKISKKPESQKPEKTAPKKKSPEITPPETAAAGNASETGKELISKPVEKAGAPGKEQPAKPKKKTRSEQAEPSRVCEVFINAVKSGDRLAFNRIIDWAELYENMCEDKESKDLAAFKKEFLDRHFEKGNRDSLKRMTRTDSDFFVETDSARLVYHFRLSPRAPMKRVYSFSLTRKQSGNWFLTKITVYLEPNQ